MRGPQCSAGTEGEGRPGQGSGGAAPCPVSVAPQGLLWSPSWGRLSLQSDSARPPSVAAAAKAAPAVGVPAGPGLFLSTLLFVFFQCHSKREEKGKKKKGRNCSEMIQSFLQKCLLSSCREGTPPHRVEKMSSTFSGPAWPWLSPGSPTPPGRSQGEMSLFLVVAGHP